MPGFIEMFFGEQVEVDGRVQLLFAYARGQA